MSSLYDRQTALQKRLGYSFKNLGLLQEALQHAGRHQDKNYERLEFLGDRVLALILAEALFMKYPQSSEGDLAKRHAVLVSRDSCVEVAKLYKIQNAISSDLPLQKMSANILADVCEAVIGAIYLEAGFVVVKKIILMAWKDMMEEMIDVPKNDKSVLQEFAAGKGWEIPIYKIIGKTGPDHAPEITVEVDVSGQNKAQASGLSRKSAEFQSG